MTPRVRYTRNGDVSLAYQVTGEGPVDLVFVTGFVTNAELLWQEPATARFLERLASFSRLIVWDKREQGLSDRLGRPPTLEENMEDLHAVLDAAGSERAALLGISEGGPMSILFAATYPHRTRALALYGSFARITSAPDYPAGIPAGALERFIERFSASWGDPMLVETFAPSAAGDPRFIEWWASLLRSGTTPRGMENLLRLYLTLDVRGALPAITVPTLVLHRAHDRVAPVAWGRYLADHIEGARYVELPGGDHLPAVGDPDAVLEQVAEFLTGQRPAREPDRILTTVLFTDIVGSTERAARLGDRRWRDLLERHNHTVADNVERFGGRLVKTIGDGALSTFDGPARAIRCACAIRSDTERLGLPIRAGVHTGECERLGEDIGGLAVHIGARVAALAGPGEVFVSRTVSDLIAGAGLRLEDRGTHELKGVPGAWQVLAVDGEHAA